MNGRDQILPCVNRSISYNELNYKITFAMLKELMEPDEFVTALELMNETAGHTNTAKRVARNIYVLDKLLRLMSYMLVHGDTSRCFKPPVDIDVKVEFYFKDLILNCNLQIDANSIFETP